MRTSFILLLFCYTTTVMPSDIYTCTEGDKTIFSQSPCGDTDIKIKVKEPQSYQSTNLSFTNKKPSQSNNKDFVTQKKIQRKIKKIEKLTEQMNKELNILKNKSASVSINRAGRLYKRTLSNEMLVISNKYKARINAEKSKLQFLQRKNIK